MTNKRKAQLIQEFTSLLEAMQAIEQKKKVVLVNKETKEIALDNITGIFPDTLIVQLGSRDHLRKFRYISIDIESKEGSSFQFEIREENS